MQTNVMGFVRGGMNDQCRNLRIYVKGLEGSCHDAGQSVLLVSVIVIMYWDIFFSFFVSTLNGKGNLNIPQ